MRRFETRLTRVEQRCIDQTRRVELVVRYYGDPQPAEDDTWALTMWVHQGWCNDPGHTGACGPRSPEED